MPMLRMLLYRNFFKHLVYHIDIPQGQAAPVLRIEFSPRPVFREAIEIYCDHTGTSIDPPDSTYLQSWPEKLPYSPQI